MKLISKTSFILLLLLLFYPKFGWSHEVRPGYLQLIQVNDTTYHMYWKVPRMGERIPKIQPQFSGNVEAEYLENPKQIQGFALYSYILTSKDKIAGKTLKINGLRKTLIDVLVNIEYSNDEKVTFMLQPDRDSMIIPGKTTTAQVIKTYSILGIEHILSGIDHLLFVLALILITRGKWKIVKTITAFTLAHSITLSLAVLGYVNFPSAPVEAVIALSIVFLAIELLTLINKKETLTSKKPWLVAFTFGLLHGFGFAGALSDIGLPQNDIPFALGFFNVGVELGQLVFVIAVLTVIKILSIKKDWPMYTKKIPAYAIGSVAAFWMIERIINFWN